MIRTPPPTPTTTMRTSTMSEGAKGSPPLSGAQASLGPAQG